MNVRYPETWETDTKVMVSNDGRKWKPAYFMPLQQKRRSVLCVSGWRYIMDKGNLHERLEIWATA